MSQVRLRNRRGEHSRTGTGQSLALLLIAATMSAANIPAEAGQPGLPSVMVRQRFPASAGRESFDQLAGIASDDPVADGFDVDPGNSTIGDPHGAADWNGTTDSLAEPTETVPCDPGGLLPSPGHCWIGRVDGLILWRDAPPARPLVESGAIPITPVLDANQLDSTATGGVRASILRVDNCSGDAWEGTYMFAGNFTAQRALPAQSAFAYALAPPGMYGNNDSQPFDSGTASLLAHLQSAELNRYLAVGPAFRWLAGFRWVQWQEQFTMQDTLSGTPGINDFYQTACANNLYGGQLGIDTRLLTLGWFRVDSLVKAGAYYNNAVQTSTYTTDDPANPGTASVRVGQSPAACSFVGEVGITGVMPLTRNLDFRFGYLGLWLTGLAQPTQQLSGQQLTPTLPTAGTLTANGGTLLQGVTLGLEGRW